MLDIAKKFHRLNSGGHITITRSSDGRPTLMVNIYDSETGEKIGEQQIKISDGDIQKLKDLQTERANDLAAATALLEAIEASADV